MPVYRLRNGIKVWFDNAQDRLSFNDILRLVSTSTQRSNLRQIRGKQILYIAILKLPPLFLQLLKQHLQLPRTNPGQYGEVDGVPFLWIRLSGSKIGKAEDWGEFFNKMSNLQSHIGFCSVAYLAVEHDMPDECVERAMHFVMMRWRITGEWFNLDPQRVRRIMNRISAANISFSGTNCRFIIGETDGPDSLVGGFYQAPNQVPQNMTPHGFVYTVENILDQLEWDYLDALASNNALPENVRNVARRLRRTIKIGSTGPDDQGNFTVASLWDRVGLHYWAKCFMDTIRVVASPSIDCRADETRLHGRYFPFGPATVTPTPGPGQRILLSARPANTRHVSREHFELTDQDIVHNGDSTWSRFLVGQVGPPYIGNGVVIDMERDRGVTPPLHPTRAEMTFWQLHGLVTQNDVNENIAAGLYTPP